MSWEVFETWLGMSSTGGSGTVRTEDGNADAGELKKEKEDDEVGDGSKEVEEG